MKPPLLGEIHAPQEVLQAQALRHSLASLRIDDKGVIALASWTR
jgi:hypothetical protein